jgi:hypothetical protein
MRIAGINSPNYHLKQSVKPQNTPSPGQPPVSDPSRLPQISGSNATTGSTQETQKFLSQQKGTLMQTSSAKNLMPGDAGASNERVRFYSRGLGMHGGAWNAYTGDAQAAASPVPDQTSHKARTAIAEYLQTQYIEERLHFEAVLGVDDYA